MWDYLGIACNYISHRENTSTIFCVVLVKRILSPLNIIGTKCRDLTNKDNTGLQEFTYFSCTL